MLLSASRFRKKGLGPDRLTRTVRLSSASMSWTKVNRDWRMLVIPSGGNTTRDRLATTSSALRGVPSWNFTPSLMLKLYVRPSALMVQSVARSGARVLRPAEKFLYTTWLYM